MSRISLSLRKAEYTLVPVSKAVCLSIENNLSIGENAIRNVQKGNPHFEDLEIREAIDDTIQADERIDTPYFDIFIKDGAVTLQGIVKDEYQKSFVEQDILNVLGVQFVDNALIAQETTRDDDHIIKDVERFLQSEPYLAEIDIITKCDAGEVTLKGKTATIAEKILLEGIVGNVSGIKKVFSRLQIKGPEASYNESARINKNREPSDIMHWNMDVGINIFQISVDRQHKTITIRGEVRDLSQKYRAEHLVRLRSPDNFSIINEISMVN